MFKEYTLIAHYGGEYDAQTVGKEYVVNMMNNRRTLHKNRNPKCYYSSGMYAFIPFNNLEGECPKVCVNLQTDVRSAFDTRLIC